MVGREISKMESALDCRGERELGKGKWSELGMNERWEVSVFKKWGVVWNSVHQLVMLKAT